MLRSSTFIDTAIITPWPTLNARLLLDESTGALKKIRQGGREKKKCSWWLWCVQMNAHNNRNLRVYLTFDPLWAAVSFWLLWSRRQRALLQQHHLIRQADSPPAEASCNLPSVSAPSIIYSVPPITKYLCLPCASCVHSDIDKRMKLWQRWVPVSGPPCSVVLRGSDWNHTESLSWKVPVGEKKIKAPNLTTVNQSGWGWY